MFIIGSFLSAAAYVLNMALWLYMWVIIARALVSWVNPDPYNPIVQLLYRATEPVLRPIRQRLPTWQTGIDFSPVIVILAIIFLQQFLIDVLYRLARMVG